MPKSNIIKPFLTHHLVTVEAWLSQLGLHRPPEDMSLLSRAFSLAKWAGEDKKNYYHFACFHEGLLTAHLLLNFNLDSHSIAAGLIYPCYRHADLPLEDITEHLGTQVSHLVQGISRMDVVALVNTKTALGKVNIENLRKMLLAMVEDVRVVVIKLAERLILLRVASQFSPIDRRLLAEEVADVYAPLANRLGLFQIKWEMEDLSFRYLEPDAYKKLASYLDERRIKREAYIEFVIHALQDALKAAGLEGFHMMGRAKHLYSIYRKMQRKGLEYNQIYDASAVRIIVSTVEDCYAALSVVHALWEPITSEFDDYIAHPKPNGYRSLHTAVKGPHNKNLEVQIRTQTMHEESELGVAAHWLYKEGKENQKSYETKIKWLRQVLDWQQELTGADQNGISPIAPILNDRVYVFTPQGDIVNLSQGATPLDFAYQVHSKIGHRCRGAKVNGHIVPLTYLLKMGDRVEILTAKQENPSRDWMNPQMGYLYTARARAKVHQWFKQQDFEKNVLDGKSILDREIKHLDVEVDTVKLAEKLHFKGEKELFAALGCGDLRTTQLTNLLQSRSALAPSVELSSQKIKTTLPTKPHAPGGIMIDGMGDLLCHTARCCKPLPGDLIIGFITRGRGVSIHRLDCLNVLQANIANQERLIAVDWSENSAIYPVDITIEAYDRKGLLRDVTTVLANEKANVSASHLTTDKHKQVALLSLTVELKSADLLSRLLEKLQQVADVYRVVRK